MMRLSVLTLFPELIRANLTASITGRALTAGVFDLETIQIRDFAVNRYGQVDDAVYGGGTGMLLMAEPVLQAWEQAVAGFDQEVSRRTIVLSPRGRRLTQQDVPELAQCAHLILICGHYEGIDQRALGATGAEEWSIGDYVLTGGELAACVLADAVLRAVPGVLPDREAYEQESHVNGLLEWDQYTRPAEWRGREVPDVLLSGHDARIARWRRTCALERTRVNRPDLFARLELSREDWVELAEWPRVKTDV